jgi:hypothetical protein
VEWVKLAQDRDKWWVVVNMVTKYRVTIKFGKILVCVNNRQLLHEGLAT